MTSQIGPLFLSADGDSSFLREGSEAGSMPLLVPPTTEKTEAGA
jgi:hypothetical protein